MATTNDRCFHCGCLYKQKLSEKYCEDCQKVIDEALSLVPRRFEFRYVDIKALDSKYQYITKEKIIEWYNLEISHGRVHRVKRPLFSTEYINDPYNIQNLIIVKVPEGDLCGVEAVYEYWSKTPQLDNIKIEVEWDLIKDKIIERKESNDFWDKVNQASKSLNTILRGDY